MKWALILLLCVSFAIARHALDERKLRDQISFRQKRMKNHTPIHMHTHEPIEKSFATNEQIRVKNGRLIDATDELGLRTFERIDVSVESKQTMYLVIGPESSGIDYIMKELVQNVGCIGSVSASQPFDVYNKGGRETMTSEDWARINFNPMREQKDRCGVMYRTLPHHRKFPNIVNMIHEIAKNGIRPFLVLIIRSEPYTIQDQITNKVVSHFEEANINIHNGLRIAFDAISRTHVDFEVISYESMQERNFVYWIHRELGIYDVPIDTDAQMTNDDLINNAHLQPTANQTETKKAGSNRVASPKPKKPIEESPGSVGKSKPLDVVGNDPSTNDIQIRSHGRRAKLLKEKSNYVD